MTKAKKNTYILSITSVDIHLPQSIMGQNEVRWSKLGGLIIILKSLITIPLSMKGASQVVATFCTHRLILSIVKRVKC